MKGSGKLGFAAVAAWASVGAMAANWLGTGGDTLWNNPANWDSSTGVPTGNIELNSAAGDYRTLTLEGDHDFNGSFIINGGTAEAPFVFNATAEAIAASNRLQQTSTSGLTLKSGAALKIESGIYNFQNDILPQGGYFEIAGGRIVTRYWMPVSGNNTIVVSGGELVTGFREGETNNGRLNLGTSVNSVNTLRMTAGRIRCSNNTNGGNMAEALTVGEQSGTTATVEISGGILQVDGKLHLGYGSNATGTMRVSGEADVRVSDETCLSQGGGSTGTLEVSGGRMSTGNLLLGRTNESLMRVTGGTVEANDIYLGYAAKGRLVVSNAVVSSGTAATTRWVDFGRGSSASAGNELILGAGAVLKAWYIHNASASDNTIVIDGGKLACLGVSGEASFIEDDDAITVTVGERGATIDTDGFSIPLAKQIVGTGTLTKIGRGTLRLTAMPTCPLFVKEGVVTVPAGASLANVTVGKKGAIVVDVSASSLSAVGDSVTLFTADAISYEDAKDTLKSTVFLIGPVVGYTLNSVTVGDKVSVTATLTDITHIASTRKVTSFVAGPAEADNTAPEHHVDNAGGFDNGVPTDNGYDVVVFPGDAHMCVYTRNSGVVNNREIGDLVVRGGTVSVRVSGTCRFPNLEAIRVAGNGLLSLRQVGLQGRGADNRMTVDECVDVEFSCEGISATQDTWMKYVTVNGNVFVTNGVTCIYDDTILNGNVTIGAYPKNSWLAVDGCTLNGTWTLDDGAGFDFRGKTVTMGEDAKLILNGSGDVQNASHVKFPVVEVRRGRHAYASFGGETVYVRGGELLLAYDAIAEDDAVVVEAGSLLIDASAAADLTVGSTLLVSNLTFAAGVTLADVAVSVVGARYAWSVQQGETGTLSLVAAALDDGPNVWVGGASGTWSTASSWTFGVPLETDTVSFTNAATVTMTGDGRCAVFQVNGSRVELRSSNPAGVHPTLRPKSITGSGVIALWHTGLVPNGVAMTIPGTFTLEILKVNADNTSDSWIEGSGNNRTTVAAPLIGDGYLIPRGKISFAGDNNGFTGKVFSNTNDKRFETPMSGFSNASSVEFQGSTSFGFLEGTITFGGLKQFRNGVFVGLNVGKGAAITVEVGKGDTACEIGEGMSFFENVNADLSSGSWSAGCAACTIRKIGTGTLKTRQVNAYQLEVAAGAVEFLADNAAVVTTVKAGAAVSGGATIGETMFETGARILQAVAWDTTADEGAQTVTTNGLQAVSTLTVGSNVFADDLVVEVANPEILSPVVKSETHAWTYPVFLTTTADYRITGFQPKTAAVYAPVGSTKDYAWVGRRLEGAIRLLTRNTRPGCVIIIQ